MNNINSIQALILVPTRELALQISSTVKEIGKYLNVQCMVSTGGTNLKEDIHRLRNQTAPVHVVVGTPGRVLDLSYKGIMRFPEDGRKYNKESSFLKTNNVIFGHISFRRQKFPTKIYVEFSA